MAQSAANDDRTSRARLTVSDQDLADYVRGALAPARRTEIEGFLAANPDVAAQVMTELHRRGRAEAPAPARRGRPLASLAVAVAACAVSAALGWQAAGRVATEGWAGLVGGTPWYVDDALESQQATQARAVMVSQADTPVMDPTEIQRTLKVRAPSLPPGWRLIDAQVYPSDDGPALNIVIEAPGGRRLNLFAVKADTRVSDTPVLARRGGEEIAYWEEGSSAFVLTGDNSRERLLGDARALARSS